MKKEEFLALRRIPGMDKPIYQRVSGYLYGLEMPKRFQLPIGVHPEKTEAGKRWHVVDLLTGLAWDSHTDRLPTLEKAHWLALDRLQQNAFRILKKQPSNVMPENRVLYDTLMFIGEFTLPLELHPLRPENTPQSCITFDSEGAQRL